jgi:ribosomal-protein-alanine N-acetyltransferase
VTSAPSRAGTGTRVRLLQPDDAADLARVLSENRAFLAPWEPEREPGYATAEHQARVVGHALAEHEAGRCVPFVVLHDGELVGRVTVADVVRGPFQSAHLGYFVTQAVNGRGVATDAVGQVVARAFGPLGLHRLQAATLLTNAASQTVLRRNGFERIGVAPDYLRIAGRWQDHVLHQRTA